MKVEVQGETSKDIEALKAKSQHIEGKLARMEHEIDGMKNDLAQVTDFCRAWAVYQ